MEIKDVVKVIEAKLKEKGSAITIPSLIVQTRAVLRKKFKNDANNLTDKTKFKKYWFDKALNSKIGTEKLVQVEGKKIDLKERFLKQKMGSVLARRKPTNISATNDWVHEIICKMDPFSVEKLFSIVVERRYSYKQAENHASTKKGNDGGLDYYGTKLDADHHHRREKLMVAQIKRHKDNIGRPDAYQFKGAVDMVKNEKKFSQVIAIFVSTSGFSLGFKEAMEKFTRTGITYVYWDGEEFARKAVSVGIGLKYKIDEKFWLTLDPKLKL